MADDSDWAGQVGRRVANLESEQRSKEHRAMKAKVLIVLAVVLLAGCDQAQLAKWEPLNDYYVKRLARKTIEAGALPEGDPKRVQLEKEVEIEQATFESIAIRALTEGIQVETDDYVVQARRTNSGSFGTVIIITEKQPVPIPTPAPASASASTRPGMVTAAPVGGQ